ncbi:MAG: hypothetical protein R2838_00280 [Caldilineaceae bacterium]
MSYANVKPCFRGYDEWATLIGDGMFSVWLGEAELDPTLSELVPCGRCGVGRGGGIEGQD